MKQLSAQQVFNRVAAHLLKQRRRSLDADGACAYRGKDGLKCAAGCLIPDRAYRPMLEGNSVEVSRVRRALRCGGIYRDAIPILLELQVMHDNVVPERWRRCLRLIAESSSLRFAP